MEIVVIEDNKDFKKLICKNLNQTLINHNYDYNVVSFSEYNKDLKRIIYNKEIKIYIIDLKLGNYSGYDICREIREAAYDWDSIIIIASVHNQKERLISLRLLIFTYLSKFYDFEKNLEDTIIKAIDIFENKKLLIINRKCKILITDICYILKEKDSKYCYIKTLDNEYRIRKSLKHLKEELHLKKIKNYILINEKNVLLRDKNTIIFKNKLEIRID